MKGTPWQRIGETQVDLKARFCPATGHCDDEYIRTVISLQFCLSWRKIKVICDQFNTV